MECMPQDLRSENEPDAVLQRVAKDIAKAHVNGRFTGSKKCAARNVRYAVVFNRRTVFADSKS